MAADILLLVLVQWPVDINAGNIGQCSVISALPGEAVSILSRSPLSTNQKRCALRSVREGLEASFDEGLLLHFPKKITVLYYCACLPGPRDEVFQSALEIPVTYGDVFKYSPCWRACALM